MISEAPTAVYFAHKFNLFILTSPPHLQIFISFSELHRTLPCISCHLPLIEEEESAESDSSDSEGSSPETFFPDPQKTKKPTKPKKSTNLNRKTPRSSSHKSSSTQAKRKQLPRTDRQEAEYTSDEGSKVSKLTHTSVLTERSQNIRQQRRAEYSQDSQMPSTTRKQGSKSKESTMSDSGRYKAKYEKAQANYERTQAKNSMLVTERDALLKERAEWEKLKAQLNAEIEALRASPRAGGRGLSFGKMNPALMNDAIADRVTAVAGSQLFRCTKFLSSDKQLIQAVELVMSYCDDGKKILAEAANKDQRMQKIEDFALIYGLLITKAINSQRSTTQSQCKTAWQALRNEKGPEGAPTPKQLLKVVLRKGMTPEEEPDEAKLKRNQEWFGWHWDEIVPKCAGKNFWLQAHRYQGLLSEHAPSDTPDLKYVTAATEAIAVLYFENSWVKWEFECRELARGVTLKEINKEDPKWKTKWSDSKVGQKMYGGWKKEGRMRFKTLLGAVERARASTQGKLAEKACLDALREKYNIQDAPKRKKRKKAEVKASQEDDFEVAFAEKSDDEITTGPQDFDDLDLDDMDVFSDDDLDPPDAQAAEAAAAAAAQVPGEVAVTNGGSGTAV